MERSSKRRVLASVAYVLLAVLALWALQTWWTPPEPEELPYSEIVAMVEKGELGKVVIGEETVLGFRTGDETPDSADVIGRRPPGVDDEAFLGVLRAHEVEIVGAPAPDRWWVPLMYGGLMLTLVLAPLVFMMRAAGRGGPLSVARGRVKIYDTTEGNPVTFRDVAGVDEAKDELREIVSFLREPQRFQIVGARIPKGVLLVGPPGTGKTLLAKAVAGEADVPFFSMSGSGFVEMFVGVGAARVRELFEQAKERAPCIIFVDEIDAIGRTRAGAGVMPAHDEREQTLHQLLTEMDGFDTKAGVVIVAATNRPEVLDPALVRAGRFDRRVIVDAPTVDGRLAILQVHTRNLPLAPDVDLMVVARRTPGMVGADLAKVANEAALAAARRRGQRVQQSDFEEAIDRIQLGLERRGRPMSEAERRRVAYHESGHALVGRSLEHADPVHRVSIIPRTIGALGVTLQLPTEDRFMLTRAELCDRICVMLAGRAAEQLVFNEISTGGQNDLERASETARQMVCRFGMSERLGPQTFGRGAGLQYLEGAIGLGDHRDHSERRAAEIDAEIDQIIGREYERAQAVLERHREALERVAAALLERETLERADLEALVRAPATRRAQGA
jgi:cell division protease FtsH